MQEDAKKITVMVKVKFVRLAWISLLLFVVAGPIMLALVFNKPFAVEAKALRYVLWFIVGMVPVAFLFTVICWIIEKPTPVDLEVPRGLR